MCFLSSMDEEVETAFLGTRSGLMRFQRYTGIEKRIAKYVDNKLLIFFIENKSALQHFRAVVKGLVLMMPA